MEARVWRAETLRRLGRPEAALADLDRAVELSPGQFWARIHRFLACRELGRGEQAAADWAAARRIAGGALARARGPGAAARLAERLLRASRGNRCLPPQPEGGRA